MTEQANSPLSGAPNGEKQAQQFQDSAKAAAQAQKPREAKFCVSIKEAIARAGLKDGMTISFHHAFRDGDTALNEVMEVIAALGIKNLTLASSSLASCHLPLAEHIRSGVVRRIYTSGLRGDLAEAISRGILPEPVQVHSHGGRAYLLESGELKIDIAFLAVPAADAAGNANGWTGKAVCGSLGYAKLDAGAAGKVVLLTEEIRPYPLLPASIFQDEVDYIVRLSQVGNPEKISSGATRMTSNPRELMIASRAAEVIAHSGYFREGFSMQTGSGGAALAVARFLEDKMRARNIKADFMLGGITEAIVRLHEQGLVGALLDVQSFDSFAAASLGRNPRHFEISARQYASPSAKSACVDRLDIVVLSALEVDIDFNVNVLTGSDGILRGAIGGHCDTAAGAKLAIVTAPLVRGRIPTIVRKVLTRVTPGSSIDIVVTDQGIAVNPARPELAERLAQAGIKTVKIEELQARAELITGKPLAIEFTDRIIAAVRYRDGTVIDTVRRLKD